MKLRDAVKVKLENDSLLVKIDDFYLGEFAVDDIRDLKSFLYIFNFSDDIVEKILETAPSTRILKLVAQDKDIELNEARSFNYRFIAFLLHSCLVEKLLELGKTIK